MAVSFSEGKEIANLNENQQAERRAMEYAGVACTYSALDLKNLAGGSGYNHMGYPSLPPTEGLCMSVARWNERIALQQGT